MVRKSGGYPVRRAEWDAFVSSNGWSGGCALNVDTGENRLGLFDDRGKPSACPIETKARRRRLGSASMKLCPGIMSRTCTMRAHSSTTGSIEFAEPGIGFIPGTAPRVRAHEIEVRSPIAENGGPRSTWTSAGFAWISQRRKLIPLVLLDNTVQLGER